MAKKGKSKQSAEEPVLTDWQKRNIEFLKKKQREERLKSEQASHFPSRRPSVDREPTEGKMPKKPIKQKKVKPVRVKKERTAQDRARSKSLPIFIVASLILLVATFYITPFSQSKQLYISGNQNALIEDIGQDTGIKASDYITSVWLFHQKYEEQLKAKNPWIKEAKISYQFPNQFTIKVKEYGILAYTLTADGYQPILENGKKVASVNASQLPDNFLTINLSNDKQIKALVADLVTLSPSLRRNIQTISLSPSKATKDLIQFDMYDGNILRVPLSEVAIKLPYYDKISTSLEAPKIIDMEAGVYTTTAELEASVTSSESSSSPKEEEASESATESTSISGEETSAQAESTDNLAEGPAGEEPSR
ncbi:cell division protein FtsQ/DivIB [Streptococcus cuniculipharyngis]|uniref:Cell division protein DivIB n=1 Tax=Streptococcus cuniculipharyngis TaxID=1562651 RepID=A0A5C5S9Z8_9STRE|nr:FtsQ-type POTRA domain-containing protein [Streptococcus cuniculipharyngis]TWS96923.1 FtsQ-type POTRA domain-containing protein [Streptococcus cuniculipharyngis]